jgi:hypothetical protein
MRVPASPAGYNQLVLPSLHCTKNPQQTVAQGQQRSWTLACATSAVPPDSDRICEVSDVAEVPIGDVSECSKLERQRLTCCRVSHLLKKPRIAGRLQVMTVESLDIMMER